MAKNKKSIRIFSFLIFWGTNFNIRNIKKHVLIVMIIWFLENGILGQSFRALHVESWRRWWTFVICFVLPKDHRVNPQSASLALNVLYTWVGKWWGWRRGWRRRRSPWSSPSPYLSFSVFSLRVCWRCWSGTLDNVVFPFALFGGSCWVCVGNIAVCVGFNCWSRSLFVLKSICKLFFIGLVNGISGKSSTLVISLVISSRHLRQIS